MLNIPLCVIAVLKEDSKYYPEALLHESFYEYEHDFLSHL